MIGPQNELPLFDKANGGLIVLNNILKVKK